MGEFADYAVDEAMEEEYQRDIFANSGMDSEEAFERGYLGPAGDMTAFADFSPDRVEIDTYESLSRDLENLELQLIGSYGKQVSSYTMATELKDMYPNLNNKAILNLFKEAPTCNSCENTMKERNGMYGSFYYCPNLCSDQKTVSKKYWDSIKKHR